MIVVLGGGAALALALALLALDQWQRAPQARSVEVMPDDAADVEIVEYEPEFEPIELRRGAHREARTARARLAATLSGAPALRLGRQRSLLSQPSRKPRTAPPVRPLARGRATGCI